MVYLERKGWLWGWWRLFTNLNIFCSQKNTGKMARAQGKHREFGINWSVATLKKETDIREDRDYFTFPQNYFCND